MTPRLTLLCHAATPALRAASFPMDEALDDRGLAAAGALAARFPKIGRVLVSPALRARQTAEAMGLLGEPCDALRECDYGRWAGLDFEAVASAEPKALAAWSSDPEACPHGGESVTALIGRVGAWLDAERFEGHTLAITHASVARAAVVHAIGAAGRAFWRIEASPLSATELRPSGRGWTLRLG
ncbi:phosphoglycerate mutase [Labrys miyagiensis]